MENISVDVKCDQAHTSPASLVDRVILEDIIPGNESDSRVADWTRDLESMYGLRLLKELEVTAKAANAFRTKSVALVETRELGSTRLEGLSSASFKQETSSMYKL